MDESGVRDLTGTKGCLASGSTNGLNTAGGGGCPGVSGLIENTFELELELPAAAGVGRLNTLNGAGAALAFSDDEDEDAGGSTKMSFLENALLSPGAAGVKTVGGRRSSERGLKTLLMEQHFHLTWAAEDGHSR
ncbi:unnamed protein product [Somion occarium]|uniref:Uncharacterized protein n=1 Tax=Somion occarium TaxID=3059160 RepID=A0ABP1E8G8_9APHY